MDEFTVEADSNVRLDLLVAARAGISRTAAATLIANGNVTVAGRREKASYRPEGGESVKVVIPASPKRELLGVDKPAGMVVHPAPGNWTGTLVNALVGRSGDLPRSDDDRAGIVHRLDK